jgi:hypothetical protein
MKGLDLKLLHLTVGVYEVNVDIFFKILNNAKSCTPLDILTLNHDYKIDSIHFMRP